jgi:hypothetical protein
MSLRITPLLQVIFWSFGRRMTRLILDYRAQLTQFFLLYNYGFTQLVSFPVNALSSFHFPPELFNLLLHAINEVGLAMRRDLLLARAKVLMH